jgi:hypothetical protein
MAPATSKRSIRDGRCEYACACGRANYDPTNTSQPGEYRREQLEGCMNGDRRCAIYQQHKEGITGRDQ